MNLYVNLIFQSVCPHMISGLRIGPLHLLLVAPVVIGDRVRVMLATPSEATKRDTVFTCTPPFILQCVTTSPLVFK